MSCTLLEIMLYYYKRRLEMVEVFFVIMFVISIINKLYEMTDYYKTKLELEKKCDIEIANILLSYYNGEITEQEKKKQVKEIKNKYKTQISLIGIDEFFI